jgi:hypothetical protein
LFFVTVFPKWRELRAISSGRREFIRSTTPGRIYHLAV